MSASSSDSPGTLSESSTICSDARITLPADIVTVALHCLGLKDCIAAFQNAGYLQGSAQGLRSLLNKTKEEIERRLQDMSLNMSQQDTFMDWVWPSKQKAKSEDSLFECCIERLLYLGLKNLAYQVGGEVPSLEEMPFRVVAVEGLALSIRLGNHDGSSARLPYHPEERDKLLTRLKKCLEGLLDRHLIHVELREGSIIVTFELQCDSRGLMALLDQLDQLFRTSGEGQATTIDAFRVVDFQ